ncbi:MAG: TonB-dependent receptor [Pseudoxanthomonas sp.]
MSRYDTKRSGRRNPSSFARLPLAAAIYLAVGSAALAQEASPAPTPTPATEREAATLDTITVTSQKRTENLQKVPISIQVLGEEKLKQLNVTDFEDYVKYLPSVSYQTFGPGFAQIYMRGVASGGDGNHSGSLPSVGVYLDEQPVTTIQGPLDIHIYDVARVEVLAGPQGTLYGASSQAGTMRIITNKPDPSGFEAGYSFELNSVSHGGTGHVAEGFVNIPIADAAAIRLVGWNQHDAGYIDNIEGDRQFPVDNPNEDGGPLWGGVVSNRDCTSTDLLYCTGRAKNDYNDIDTTGARLALRVDLNDNWTISPTVMGQRATSNGLFAFDEVQGDLAVKHFYPERTEDKWVQAALTVEGKIGNFDLTYSFAHLKRDDDVDSDYSDYSFWYDSLAGSGAYLYDDSGTIINPSQYIQGVDGYKKTSHELRISSPEENRFRFVGGLFWQDQRHDIQQDYRINNLATDLSVPGWPGTIWLTKQIREDHDEAVFGEFTFDITDKLTAMAGFRSFRVDNTLKGFHGFASYIVDDPENPTDAFCADPDTAFMNAPCVNIDKGIKEHDTIGKVNLTYQFDDSKMIYATWSEGYRPGGNNRRGSLPPYVSDYLTNYELGWKTTWFDNSLSFNGSVFRQEWKDFQFSILGANGLTEIKNANQARITGAEMELNWAATYNLNISGGAAFYDAKLTENFCGFTDDDGNPVTDCPDPEAPDGTRLPVTPEFKGNLTARYNFDIGGFQAYVQGGAVHVGQRTSDLRILERGILGELPSYTTADFSAGIAKDSWALDLFISNAFDERAVISRFTQCGETICGASGVVAEYPNGQIYTVTNQPRTVGIRFSQKF